jgi:hypothetical protein
MDRMAELKTKVNNKSPLAFIKTIANEEKRKDAEQLLRIFTEVTGEKPRMWGESIIGYGQYHYESERSSQKGDWPLTGFSPRKAALTIYIMPGFEAYADLMENLGTCKTSRSCLYVKHLSNLHIPTLKKLIKRSVADMRRKYNA